MPRSNYATQAEYQESKKKKSKPKMDNRRDDVSMAWDASMNKKRKKKPSYSTGGTVSGSVGGGS